MHMHVHMRHLLEGRGTNGMPQTHALIGEGPVNGSGDLYQCIHQPSASSWIEVPYVVSVYPRHHQYMSGIVLTRIDEGDGQIILVDDVSRRATRNDLAEDAFGDHSPGQRHGITLPSKLALRPAA